MPLVLIHVFPRFLSFRPPHLPESPPHAPAPGQSHSPTQHGQPHLPRPSQQHAPPPIIRTIQPGYVYPPGMYTGHPPYGVPPRGYARQYPPPYYMTPSPQAPKYPSSGLSPTSGGMGYVIPSPSTPKVERTWLISVSCLLSESLQPLMAQLQPRRNSSSRIQTLGN